VSAERHHARAEGDKVYAVERPQGRFSRQLRLSERFDADGIEVGYEYGVLTVTVPVAENPKARKIAVTTSGAPAVEGDAAEAA
jgi:HSP20 family protein